MMSTSEQAGSAWAPLRVGIFRALWMAALVSNIGTWMQTVGAQWLLVHQPHASLLVALGWDAPAGSPLHEVRIGREQVGLILAAGDARTALRLSYAESRLRDAKAGIDPQGSLGEAAGLLDQARAALPAGHDEVIDARHLLVMPGAIDPHTHMDLFLVLYPHGNPVVNFGVTTIVIGDCGASCAPVPDGEGPLLAAPVRVRRPPFPRPRRPTGAVTIPAPAPPVARRRHRPRRPRPEAAAAITDSGPALRRAGCAAPGGPARGLPPRSGSRASPR